MIHKILMAATIFAAANCAVAADARDVRATTLYCTGTTWQFVATTSEVQTDALVRLTSTSIYIEVSGVAAGTSTEPPRASGSTSVTGSLSLTRINEGGGRVSVGYNLNRYNGDLLVYPSDSNGKAFFNGSCKPAIPLF